MNDQRKSDATLPATAHDEGMTTSTILIPLSPSAASPTSPTKASQATRLIKQRIAASATNATKIYGNEDALVHALNNVSIWIRKIDVAALPRRTRHVDLRSNPRRRC
jgi:hypothetical protein